MEPAPQPQKRMWDMRSPELASPIDGSRGCSNSQGKGLGHRKNKSPMQREEYCTNIAKTQSEPKRTR